MHICKYLNGIESQNAACALVTTLISLMLAGVSSSEIHNNNAARNSLDYHTLITYRGAELGLEQIVGIKTPEFAEKLNAIIDERQKSGKSIIDPVNVKSQYGSRMPGYVNWKAPESLDEYYGDYARHQVQGAIHAFVQAQVVEVFSERFANAPVGYKGLSADEYEFAIRRTADLITDGTRLYANLGALKNQGQLTKSIFVSTMSNSYPKPSWDRIYPKFIGGPRLSIIDDALFRPFLETGEYAPWYRNYIQAGELNAHVQLYVEENREELTREVLRKMSMCSYVYIQGADSRFLPVMQLIGQKCIEEGNASDLELRVEQLARRFDIEQLDVRLNSSISGIMLQNLFEIAPEVWRSQSGVGRSMIRSDGSVAAGSEGLIWIGRVPGTLRIQQESLSSRPGGWLFNAVLMTEVRMIYLEVMNQVQAFPPFTLLNAEEFLLVSRSPAISPNLLGVEIFDEPKNE